jgi:hypothetical protein
MVKHPQDAKSGFARHAITCCSSGLGLRVAILCIDDAASHSAIIAS